MERLPAGARLLAGHLKDNLVCDREDCDAGSELLNRQEYYLLSGSLLLGGALAMGLDLHRRLRRLVMHPAGQQLLFESGDAVIGSGELSRQPLNLNFR